MSSPILPARERAKTLWLAGLFVLLVVAVYSDPVFARRNFGGRDPMGYHYPLEKAIHDAYARGRLPVWISEISGGRPLLANPNVGALYPIRPLLSRFSFPFAIRLFPVLHWAGAGIGIILLLRVLGVSPPGAWVGAVTYVFSGASVSYVFYPNSHPGMALLPWIVWGIARPARNMSRGALVLSFFWTAIILAGDVFTVALALLGSLLWILLDTEPRQRGARFIRLAAALGLASLAAAPQILASALWIPETNRAVLGMRLNEAVLFSVSPFRLLELIVPFPFGTTWELDRAQTWGWPLFHYRQLGYFSGLYAGAFAVLHSPIPLRYPEKFAVSLSLGLAILAGLAFDAFRRGRKRSWPLWAGVVLAVLGGVAALLPGPSGRLAVRVIGAEAGLAVTAGRLLPGALAEAGLLWIATVVALDALPHGTRQSLLACLAILTLVPIAANRRIAVTLPEQQLFAPSPLDRFLWHADPRQDYRTLDESGYSTRTALPETDTLMDVTGAAFARRSWLFYTHALWDRGTVFNGDLDSGDLSRLDSLRRLSYVAAGYRDSQAFFGSLALKWGIRMRDQAPLAGYHRIRGDAFVDWDEHDSAFPDVRLVERWREEPGALPALNSLGLLGQGEVVIESGARESATARPGSLRFLEKTPERLRVAVESPDATWLFVLRAYWNHRTVLVDGNPTEDVPAQLAFSAVRVPAGRHTIDWTEEVPGGSVSRWGPVLFAIAAAAIVARGGKGSKR